jgi:hypothetical protein
LRVISDKKSCREEMERDTNPKDPRKFDSTIKSDPLVAAPRHPHYISLTAEHQESDLEGVQLEFLDYIALFVALLQTVFLPILIMMGVFALLTFILYNL